MTPEPARHGITSGESISNDTTLALPSSPERLTRKPEEVGALLGVGRNGVYQLIREKKLRSIKVGRKILIPVTAIAEFLNRADN